MKEYCVYCMCKALSAHIKARVRAQVPVSNSASESGALHHPPTSWQPQQTACLFRYLTNEAPSSFQSGEHDTHTHTQRYQET